MKNRYVAILVVCLLSSLTAVAADFPKADVFGGYQYTHFDSNGFGQGANGWNGALTGNLNSWFGVTGDFSGAYATVSGVSFKVHTYTFGPVITARRSGGFTPFAHALFGGFHASAGFQGLGASTSGFSTMLGGGVDARLSDRFSLRAVQVDWMLLRDNGSTEFKNVRISTGLVMHF